LITEILPRIRIREPQAELHICGSRQHVLKAEFSTASGIHFTGFKPDLAAMYLEASALVAPLTLATGTQYKILEAMAVGLPVVTTTRVAATGPFQHGHELWVANSSEEFAESVLALLSAPAAAWHLGEASRARIQAQFIWEVKLPILQTALGEWNTMEQAPL
jgi:hypothetical protein